MEHEKCQEKVGRRCGAIRMLNLWTLAMVCAAIVLGFPGCSGGGALSCRGSGNRIPDPDATATPRPVFTLTTISPNSVIRPLPGAPDARVNVVLTGTNLGGSGLRVQVGGTGMTIVSFVVNSSTQISAVIGVSSAATFGSHPVGVITDDFTSNTLGFQVVSANPATLTTITPASGAQGAAVNVIIRGTNFVQGSTTVEVGGGISVSNLSVTASNFISATFNMTPTASLGSHQVRVNTNGERSNNVLFDVTPAAGAPTLTSIRPTSGRRAQEVSVTLTGTNFVVGSTTVRVSGTSVIVVNPTVTSPTRLLVLFDIGSVATLGARNVTVTTPNGTSNAVTFTVNTNVTPTPNPTPNPTPTFGPFPSPTPGG